MKLLFDQNLSFQLVQAIQRMYPDSTHVRTVGLERAEDQTIWEYAAREGFIIVSKDDDFHQRSFVFGHPPKVIWIRLGNCSTKQIERLLQARHTQVMVFAKDRIASFLALT